MTISHSLSTKASGKHYACKCLSVFLRVDSALVPAFFLLLPTHIVYLTDGGRKYTLIFFTPSTGGWQNKVTLSSQGLKVFIITLVLPHVLWLKSPYLQQKLRSDRVWVNPGHWLISLSVLIHLFVHPFNKHASSISYVSDTVLSTGNMTVNKTDKIPVFMQFLSGVRFKVVNMISKYNI